MLPQPPDFSISWLCDRTAFCSPCLDEWIWMEYTQSWMMNEKWEGDPAFRIHRDEKTICKLKAPWCFTQPLRTIYDVAHQPSFEALNSASSASPPTKYTNQFKAWGFWNSRNCKIIVQWAIHKRGHNYELQHYYLFDGFNKMGGFSFSIMMQWWMARMSF